MQLFTNKWECIADDLHNCFYKMFTPYIIHLRLTSIIATAQYVSIFITIPQVQSLKAWGTGKSELNESLDE